MDRNALAGDFPLEVVDRRDTCRVTELRRLLLRSNVDLRDLLPKGVINPPDQEALRSSGDANDCVGEVIKSGDSKESLTLPGGVRTSSAMGDAVESDVREVGWSISVPAIESLSGLPECRWREAPVGIPRSSWGRFES